MRAQYGLDQPILVQFGDWLSRFVVGDWGTSIGGGEKVYDMFMRRLPATLELFLGATLWSFAIGIPAGIVGALKRNSADRHRADHRHHDRRIDPGFWEGIMLIYSWRSYCRSCRPPATCRSPKTRCRTCD